jgi:hypothetical protein
MALRAPSARDCDEGHGIAGHTSITIARRALSESLVDRKGDLSIEAGHLAVCGGRFPRKTVSELALMYQIL